MEREIYEEMRLLQREHWWFLGRRRVLAALIGELHLRPGARILEAGAGSGGNVAMLQRFGEVSAFDMDAQAAGYCLQDTGVECLVGALPDGNPFQGNASFDLVVALDVLEHIDRDVDSLRSLASCLAPGGRVLLTVPACQWLYSGHDVVHHHRRRYDRRGLAAVVSAADLRVRRISHYNSLLFPLVAGVRLGQRLLGRRARTDTRMGSSLANGLLATVFGSEAAWLRRAGFPVGASLFVLAERG
jgi:SAM-dependent methyltransferase